MEVPQDHHKNTSAPSQASLLSVGGAFKPKRTTSHQDKEVNTNLHGQPQEPPTVKPIDDKSSSCLKCEIL
ncbi:hypothetical protein SteCoe_19806 [Stentor coeruleus]|uniref:Uncharacterized protein n=1 Tax=Stentor coeruleus TaxID=5963 RepID=A0A1R2BTX9_9CILI|nr:hypothetical protein SteCoe_19806 [Stentor coeruleus]